MSLRAEGEAISSFGIAASLSLLAMTTFMNYLKKIRLYSGYLFFLFLLFLAEPTVLSYWVGLFVILFGEVIRIWAAGYIVKDELLIKNGPYQLVRNPLYLGSFLIGLGAVIIGRSPWFLLAFALIFLSTYLPAILKEKKFLAKKFADDYPDYQKTVPSFFPKFRVLKKNLLSEALSRGGFSWKRVKKNKEFHTWFALFLILMILGLKIK